MKRMTLQKLEYDEVLRYLQTYSAPPGCYDFNGLLGLILAGVENLRVNCELNQLPSYAAAWKCATE